MGINLDLLPYEDEHVIQVKIPVPLALKTVNSYLLKDQNKGYVWVDPGLNTEHIQELWQQVFSHLGITPKQITKIVCTHQHPDHFGLAGYAQQLTDAPVYLSESGFAYANELWGENEVFAAQLSELFSCHQVPSTLIEAIVDNLNWFKTVVYPFPEVTTLAANSELIIGEQSWTTIETSGHAKGHMMLYNTVTKQMICGDQVLPRITPHVGVVPGEEEERPLFQFLSCLNQIKHIDVNEIFPGHGDKFLNWGSRIEAIISHHERRLTKLVQLVHERETLSAFEASNLVFGIHLHKQPQNLRFAITEMIAHLDYLVEQDKLIKQFNNNGLIYYQNQTKK